jgi:glucose/arabinose dehydrogenase
MQVSRHTFGNLPANVRTIIPTHRRGLAETRRLFASLLALSGFASVLPILMIGTFLVAACTGSQRQQATPPPQIEVVVDGLFAPVGLAALPDGALLVAEEGTGRRDDSAGVTLITADGQVGRLVSGLPSSRKRKKKKVARE